ncbi:MAG: low molecular weight phosphotyrosine protein phosphatase [Xanthomonadales bacterium]|nr:low molecular weight phosphotyrosine protein phosphatase [Xanthomonadales bacterium]
MNNILFVCLGNICRSPLAEGFLRHHAKLKGCADSFNIDSAGTGNWHSGKSPDRRVIRAAAEYGVDISALRARQISNIDFDRFQHIIALDRDNLTDLEHLRPSPSANCRLSLFSDLIDKPGFIDVPDPWYGSYADFESVSQQLDRACKALLEKLLTDA